MIHGNRQFVYIINFDQYSMDDLMLDIFTNSKKERIANKNYEEIPLRLSQKKASDSNRIIDSTISIAKNLIQPRPSDAFQNLMKGILDMNKRIDEKYSKKNIEGQTKAEQKTKSSESSKWGAKIDKINEQKNEEGYSKEEIGIGTSAKYLDPAMPIRVISPEGSRIMVGPDNSRIVFPPQIIQVRPLSSPKPVYVQRHPIYEPSQSRLIMRQPSPTRIVSYPINRSNFEHPVPVRFENHPVMNRVISQPQFNHPGNQMAYSPQSPNPMISNPYMIYQNPNNAPAQFLQQSPRPVSQQQALSQKQSKIMQSRPSQSQQTQNLTPVPSTHVSGAAATINNGTPITAEMYQKMMQQHAQQYNNQNEQMMKMLAQMTEGQKQQYLNQKMLSEQLKKQGTQVNVRNIINQKQVTQISKIEEKNIVNKENISNVENVVNQQNTMNMLNQANMLNIMQKTNNVNNQTNGIALQYLNQAFVNPALTNGQPIAVQGRQPLQVTGSNRLISSKQLPNTSSHKVLAPPPRISPEQQLLNQKVQSQMFNELINAGFDDLQKQGDYINVSGQLSDLNDIKTQNTRDGVLILRKMDTILSKYGTPASRAKQIDEITQKSKNIDAPLFDSIIDKVSSRIFQKPESPKRSPLFESKVNSYSTHKQPVPTMKQQPEKTIVDPPAQNKIDEMPEPDILFSQSEIAPVTAVPAASYESTGPIRLSKQKLSLAKDMTFDFYNSK